MLAILDYKAGNQTSVRRALDHLGIPCVITADPAVVDSAAGVIFPGVGAAGQAMRHLQDSGLDAVLRNVVSSGRPLLGICLGCQIMVAHSDENDHADPRPRGRPLRAFRRAPGGRRGAYPHPAHGLEHDFPQAGEPHPEGCPG